MRKERLQQSMKEQEQKFILVLMTYPHIKREQVSLGWE